MLQHDGPLGSYTAFTFFFAFGPVTVTVHSKKNLKEKGTKRFRKNEN